MPAAPSIYSTFVWRREMGVDYFTAMRTPIGVIRADLEMMSLEQKWGPASLNGESGEESPPPGIIRQVVGQ